MDMSLPLGQETLLDQVVQVLGEMLSLDPGAICNVLLSELLRKLVSFLHVREVREIQQDPILARDGGQFLDGHCDRNPCNSYLRVFIKQQRPG